MTNSTADAVTSKERTWVALRDHGNSHPELGDFIYLQITSSRGEGLNGYVCLETWERVVRTLEVQPCLNPRSREQFLALFAKTDLTQGGENP